MALLIFLQGRRPIKRKEEKLWGITAVDFLVVQRELSPNIKSKREINLTGTPSNLSNQNENADILQSFVVLIREKKQS